jgi:hypothetical protein
LNLQKLVDKGKIGGDLVLQLAAVLEHYQANSHLPSIATEIAPSLRNDRIQTV